MTRLKALAYGVLCWLSGEFLGWIAAAATALLSFSRWGPDASRTSAPSLALVATLQVTLILAHILTALGFSLEAHWFNLHWSRSRVAILYSLAIGSFGLTATVIAQFITVRLDDTLFAVAIIVAGARNLAFAHAGGPFDERASIRAACGLAIATSASAIATIAASRLNLFVLELTFWIACIGALLLFTFLRGGLLIDRLKSMPDPNPGPPTNRRQWTALTMLILVPVLGIFGWVLISIIGCSGMP